MDLLDLLDLLDNLDVELHLMAGTGPGPRLRATSPAPIPPDAAGHIREHRTMLVNTLIGRMSGHAPAPCDQCGRVSLVAIVKPDGHRRDPWPACRLTPRCEGRHVARDVDIARTNPAPQPPQARQPRRISKSLLLGTWPEWPTP